MASFSVISTLISLLVLITLIEVIVSQYNFGKRSQEFFNKPYTSWFEDDYSKQTGTFSDKDLYGYTTFAINGELYSIHYTADKHGYNPKFTLKKGFQGIENQNGPPQVHFRYRDPTLVAIMVG